jgi:hypothetical protein
MQGKISLSIPALKWLYKIPDTIKLRREGDANRHPKVSISPQSSAPVAIT